MKQIRYKTFETNSSSSHSLVVTKEFYGSDGKYNNRWGLKLKKSDTPVYDFETIRGSMCNLQTRKDPYYVLYLTGDDFGKEQLRYVINSYNKANYLASYIKERIETKSQRKYYEKLLSDTIKKGIPELDEVRFNTPIEDDDVNPDCFDSGNEYYEPHIDGDSVRLPKCILEYDGVELKDFGVFTIYDFIFNRSYILLSGEDYRFWEKYDTWPKTIKIDDNTYFTVAAALRDDEAVYNNPNYFKERNKEHNSDFDKHIKLDLHSVDVDETLSKLEEK